jgi:hypothetical protein
VVPAVGGSSPLAHPSGIPWSLVDPDGVTDLGINEIAARFEEVDARPGLGALGIHCVDQIEELGPALAGVRRESSVALRRRA